MKIEFPALNSDALVYFLYHSGLFVFALAGVFFTLGLCLGHAFWGRYKKRARALAAESESQLAEIVDLKRKLAEQALRPAPTLEPAPVPAPPQRPPEPVISPAFAFAPAPVLQDLPAMPELAPHPMLAEPPLPLPTRAARPRPTAPAKVPGVEAAAIAPFSFLMDEPGQEPSSSED